MLSLGLPTSEQVMRLEGSEGPTHFHEFRQDVEDALYDLPLSDAAKIRFICRQLGPIPFDELDCRPDGIPSTPDEVFRVLDRAFGDDRDPIELILTMYSLSQFPGESIRKYSHRLHTLWKELQRLETKRLDPHTICPVDTLGRMFVNGLTDMEVRKFMFHARSPRSSFFELREMALEVEAREIAALMTDPADSAPFKSEDDTTTTPETNQLEAPSSVSLAPAVNQLEAPISASPDPAKRRRRRRRTPTPTENQFEAPVSVSLAPVPNQLEAHTSASLAPAAIQFEVPTSSSPARANRRRKRRRRRRRKQTPCSVRTVSLVSSRVLVTIRSPAHRQADVVHLAASPLPALCLPADRDAPLTAVTVFPRDDVVGEDAPSPDTQQHQEPEAATVSPRDTLPSSTDPAVSNQPMDLAVIDTFVEEIEGLLREYSERPHCPDRPPPYEVYEMAAPAQCRGGTEVPVISKLPLAHQLVTLAPYVSRVVASYLPVPTGPRVGQIVKKTPSVFRALSQIPVLIR